MKPYLYGVHWYLKRKRKRDTNPGPLLGWPVQVPRLKKKNVSVLLYRPVGGTAQTLPVLFNVHGGAWIHGDAMGVDLQSQYLANHLKCLVVNVDYLRADEKPFPYPQTEVADTVQYFLEQAETYHIDPARAAIMGYSAGGHICAGAALLLRDRGIKIGAQVLCYPFLDFTGFDFARYGGLTGLKGKMLNKLSDTVLFERMPKTDTLLSPAAADPAELKGLAKAVIITCGAHDPLLPQGEAYAEKLRAAGVPTVYREYKTAVHGFMERNFRDDPAVFAHEDEQDTLSRDAVEFVKAQSIFGADA